MKIEDILPIGSVVRLKNGVKKLVIFGIKQTNLEKPGEEYDYLGVLYPEGHLGKQFQYLFNHEDIETVIFRGYEDRERDAFIHKLASFYGEKIGS